MVPYIADSLSKLKEWRAGLASPWLLGEEQFCRLPEGADVGFVPTMGALHDGHIELVRRARKDCKHVIVSIFVNPYQFAPTEDFDKYPRTFERDLALLKQANVDCVFYPSEAEMYPFGREGIVSVLPATPLNDTLEGAFRPTFFRGVATVVTKLFTLVQPHVAYFGEKDFQQLLVIKALTRDLDLPLKVVGVPTVRETDGLAMSSRNAYLDVDKRKLAPVLHRTLSAVKHGFKAGVRLPDAVAAATAELKAVNQLDLQYLSVCDAETLAPLQEFALPFVVLVAAKLGEVRLIDNIVVRA
ncbi:MAG: pantoate--beta-alanine ligase [Cyanobacteria bacterium SZAS LIN-3]|nr:pantoate--beta-alanine ligase [Cyanobacteria bacterium SZAS LIN-3]